MTCQWIWKQPLFVGSSALDHVLSQSRKYISLQHRWPERPKLWLSLGDIAGPIEKVESHSGALRELTGEDKLQRLYY